MSTVLPLPQAGRARRGRTGAVVLHGVLAALAAGAAFWLPAGIAVAVFGLFGALLAWWTTGAAPARRGTAPASSGPPLPQSDGLLHLLYERSPLGLTLRRLDGSCVRANAAFQQLSGYTLEELRGLDRLALTPPDRMPERQRARDQLLEYGTFQAHETEMINRDGMRVPVRVSGVLTESPDGEPMFWSIVEDITARKRMSEALKHSESEARMLSAVASHTHNMVVICDREGRIEWVNQAFEKTTGYTRREAIGKLPGALLNGADTDPAAADHIAGRIAAAQAFSAEILNYAKDGRAFWVAVECVPVFDHAGVLERFVAIKRDITETRGILQALTQSEERFRDLTELSSDFFWEQDSEFRFVQMTEVTARAAPNRVRLGVRPWDNPYSLNSPEQWARHRADLEGHLPFIDFENALVLEDGRVMWRSISGKPLFGPDGSFAGYRGVGRDITARKQAEELLQESKRKYRRVVEGVRDIIFQTDAQGHFTFLNRAWTESTGYSVEESLGEPIQDYVHPDERVAALRIVNDVTGSQGESHGGIGRVRSRDGSYRWFEVRVQSYLESDGSVMTAGTLHDVTQERAAHSERRAAQAALQLIQERYQRALDGANDGMWERDLRTEQVFYSARFKQLLGFAEDEFPHLRRSLHVRIHREDRRRFVQSMSQMLAQRSRSVIEYRLRCRDGAYRWFRLRSTVTCDATGVPILTSGTLTDIHEARLAEEELKRHRDGLAGLVEERTASAEAARAEAERAREAAETANRSKSEFLANMSHELRTPMHAILSFANFGAEKAPQAGREKLAHYFANIQKGGQRLLALLNDLLDLSKLEAGKMEMHLAPADPAELLRDALAEADALAKSGDIHLRLYLPEAPLRAQLDGPRILQVIGNLLSNAIKFSPPGGVVEVMLAAAPAGIEISVRDQGLGIPEEELEAVFDKFVQSSKTKTGAGGTGLGLAICREIAHGHHGSIRARNNPPPAAGACFVLALPGAARVDNGAPPKVMPAGADPT